MGIRSLKPLSVMKPTPPPSPPQESAGVPSSTHIVFLVHVKHSSGAITMEGLFINNRPAAEALAIERGGWVTPVYENVVFPAGNCGPHPDAYWPQPSTPKAEWRCGACGDETLRTIEVEKCPSCDSWQWKFADATSAPTRIEPKISVSPEFLRFVEEIVDARISQQHTGCIR